MTVKYANRVEMNVNNWVIKTKLIGTIKTDVLFIIFDGLFNNAMIYCDFFIAIFFRILISKRFITNSNSSHLSATVFYYELFMDATKK